MHLLRLDIKESVPFPVKNEVVVGTDFDCDIQINHPDLHGKHFSIFNQSYGCVLKVLAGQVMLNNHLIHEQCMVEPGETLTIGGLSLRLTDNEFIPKNSSINHTQIELSEKPNQSAVFGLRSFEKPSSGAFIIDDFHHTEGWHVIRQGDEMHYIDSKHVALLNGLQVAQAKLSNGDVIMGKDYKFKVELPGTSGYSKFSPSHPRNVLLSETMQRPEKNTNQGKVNEPSFVKNNLWWMTLLVGLILLTILIINSPQA